MNESRHIWLSQIHMNESCHLWMRYVRHKFVITSRVIESVGPTVSESVRSMYVMSYLCVAQDSDMYVAVCCSVLQCVAVCCSVLQCVAVRSMHVVSMCRTRLRYVSLTYLWVCQDCILTYLGRTYLSNWRIWDRRASLTYLWVCQDCILTYLGRTYWLQSDVSVGLSRLYTDVSGTDVCI